MVCVVNTCVAIQGFAEPLYISVCLCMSLSLVVHVHVYICCLAKSQWMVPLVFVVNVDQRVCVLLYVAC